jgi:hypothetical protein
MGSRIWLSSPHIGLQEQKYVQEAFDTNWVAPLGPNVDAFEKQLTDYLQVHGAVSLSSGTAALHLALATLGVGPGDRVLCQSLTFAASAFPIVYLGAEPVFIDSELDTWNMDPELLKTAIFRIMLGLSKKLFIADFLSRYVDMVHVQPSGYSGLENILCMYAYSFQIYFDFSGYSDIAIGIALLMGYALKENFMNPYHATNITDFWRRWHISLSTWLRDYIYIPLGGNRKGVFNTYVFLMITMLVGGIWHGASWNFIVWGIAHGLALVVHKALSEKEDRNQENKFASLKRFVGVVFTFHLVSFLWIFFRAVDFKHAFESINQMMAPIKISDFVGFYFARPEVVGMLFLSAFLVFISSKLKLTLSKAFNKTPLLLIAFSLLILFQLILQIKNNEIAPFIYFQF